MNTTTRRIFSVLFLVMFALLVAPVQSVFASDENFLTASASLNREQAINYGKACESVTWHGAWRNWFDGDDHTVYVSAMSSECQRRFNVLAEATHATMLRYHDAWSNYFRFIDEDGDYLNDYLTHVPNTHAWSMLAIGASNAVWFEGHTARQQPIQN